MSLIARKCDECGTKATPKNQVHPLTHVCLRCYKKRAKEYERLEKEAVKREKEAAKAKK